MNDIIAYRCQVFLIVFDQALISSRWTNLDSDINYVMYK